MVDNDQWLVDNGYQLRECYKCKTLVPRPKEEQWWVVPYCNDCKSKEDKHESITTTLFRLWFTYGFLVFLCIPLTVISHEAMKIWVALLTIWGIPVVIFAIGMLLYLIWHDSNDGSM